MYTVRCRPGRALRGGGGGVEAAQFVGHAAQVSAASETAAPSGWPAHGAGDLAHRVA